VVENLEAVGRISLNPFDYALKPMCVHWFQFLALSFQCERPLLQDKPQNLNEIFHCRRDKGIGGSGTSTIHS